MNKQSKVVQEGYNKLAKKYNKERHRYVNDALLKRFAKHLKKGSKVLDLGCGAGIPIDRFLVKNGYKVTGIDFARNMLKAAKKNVPRAKYIQMDMTKMKFKPDSFDAAVSFYAIIHVPKEKHTKLYKDLHKILKSDGIIFVNASGHKKWEGYGNFMGTRMFWSHYAPAKTLGIIRKSGFKILWRKVLKLGGEKQFWVLARNMK
ncbi:MAG: methyltransferase domain-containing protein [Candidatus Aenigmarchaeota archaeon]|nr:methyltransferase domain-containing protein [Candidatus Aenigmarchaeota archaeon]